MADRIISIYRGNETLFSRVKLAGTFGTKWRGLMYYHEMPAIDGLLLFPCNWIHMFGMGFSLDLIYLSRDGEVLSIVNGLVPNRIGPLVKAAYYVLEIQAGVANAKNISVGDRMGWES